MTVRTDFDPEQDFTGYKTYRWPDAQQLNPNDALQQNPLIAKRIMASVNKVLQEKGFNLAESGEVDFIVVIHAGVEDRMQVTNWGGHYGGWYDPWWGAYGGTTTVSYYQEGTLVIDVVDTKEMELTWRGIGTDTVKGIQDPDKMQERFDQVVTKIMADFPPGAAAQK
jgi:hypothetical protein